VKRLSLPTGARSKLNIHSCAITVEAAVAADAVVPLQLQVDKHSRRIVDILFGKHAHVLELLALENPLLLWT
jgi:hypothetical protein